MITQGKTENIPKILKSNTTTCTYSSSEVSSERQSNFDYCSISLFIYLNSKVILPFCFVKISEYTPSTKENNQK